MFFVGKGEKERVRMPCFARRKKSELACSLEIFGRKKKLTNLTTAAIGLRKKNTTAFAPVLPLSRREIPSRTATNSCPKSRAAAEKVARNREPLVRAPGSREASPRRATSGGAFARSLAPFREESLFFPHSPSLPALLSLSLSLLSFDDRDGVITCEAPIRVSLCIQGLSGCGELV